MPVVERASVIDADFATTWEFYDDIEELEVLTPDPLGLRVRRIDAPADAAGGSFSLGTEIHLDLRPFGVIPVVADWVVRIVDRSVGDRRAYFIDEQVDGHGPFGQFRHRHEFADLDGRTLVYDRITYRKALGTDLPIATPVFHGMLWHRHRRTRELLE